MSPQAIRDAVAAGDYSGAATLFDEYARSLPLDEVSLAELEELLNWTRTTVLCSKAHAQDQVRRLEAELHIAAAYGR